MSKDAVRKRPTRPGAPVGDGAQLAADLKRAAAASPATRIEHRDRLAAHGPTVVEPLLGWVRQGRMGYFVIRVFESLASADRRAALKALEAVARADSALTNEVHAATERIKGAPADTSSAGPTARRTGVLDQVTPFGPPVESGDCQGITQKGEPCRNPGRYWVGDKLSCSRGHAEYR